MSQSEDCTLPLIERSDPLPSPSVPGYEVIEVSNIQPACVASLRHRAPEVMMCRHAFRCHALFGHTFQAYGTNLQQSRYDAFWMIGNIPDGRSTPPPRQSVECPQTSSNDDTHVGRHLWRSTQPEGPMSRLAHFPCLILLPLHDILTFDTPSTTTHSLCTHVCAPQPR